MDALHCKLSSIVVHLVEHIETGQSVDLDAARFGLRDPEVQKFFREASNQSLIPLPRQPLQMIPEA